jgi:hypothetical protein
MPIGHALASFLLALVLSAGTALAQPRAEAQNAPADMATDARDPAAIITALYESYENDDPEAGAWDMTPELAGLMTRASELPDATENGYLEFDPIIDGQDWDISDLSVTVVTPPANGAAVIRAQFKNLGEAKDVTFDMKEVNGTWLIDNIRYPSWNLRGQLAESGIT